MQVGMDTCSQRTVVRLDYLMGRVPVTTARMPQRLQARIKSFGAGRLCQAVPESGILHHAAITVWIAFAVFYYHFAPV